MSSFYDNLTQWVEMQKKTKNLFENLYEDIKKGDRLDLILATRAAFQHMIKTLKAFDNWLQDPMIISHMPKEYLEEVWDVAYKLLQQLLELDIRHTSSFRDYIEKLEKEGRLNPILASGIISGGRRRGGREEITLSM
ncbi:MAG TPA: DUF2153 domain-containing protein [Ignisphaera sp.]|nr:DUF2153 domain-containing protein [Ignisphaera sp.]